MIEKYVETRSGRVYYWIPEVLGEEKRTLFFLHGMTGDHTMFEKQVAYFATEYNVIFWDAPAHGKSRPFQHFDYIYYQIFYQAICI